jgi:hypothetical protein
MAYIGAVYNYTRIPNDPTGAYTTTLAWQWTDDTPAINLADNKPLWGFVPAYSSPAVPPK